MDVSGWTVEQRMRLPDYCFGNRELHTVHAEGVVDDTYCWAKSEVRMPDPMCFWEFTFYNRPNATGKGYARLGLADAVPTSVAEMDNAVEVLPRFAFENVGPNRIELYESFYTTYNYNVRKGIDTGGKYFVVELYTLLETMRFNISFVASGLPTNMEGWLAHKKV